MGVAVLDDKRKYVLLNGNEIGALLAEYRITRLKELGCLPENGTTSASIIKTFVTSPLVDAIAKGHGLRCVNTLTGFKWTGEKIRKYEDVLKNELLEKEGIYIDYDKTDYFTRINLGIKYGTAFIFACEESYGYLPYDFVRDKDGNASTIAFCELLSHLSKNKITAIEYLNSIYVKYGCYDQNTVNLYFEGASGAEKINKIVNSYIENPPREIGGIKVKNHKNFGNEGYKDEDGEPIPLENFHILALENNFTFAVRASGSEPKIKFYVFGNEIVRDRSELSNVKSRISEKIINLSESIKADALERADN